MSETDKKYKNIGPFLIMVGIAGIAFNLYYKHDRYYTGEVLMERTVVIEHAPEYVDVHKGTDRYTFGTVEDRCRFWISEGALRTVRRDDYKKNVVENIRVGDTIKIKIRKNDENWLDNPGKRPRIIEMIVKNETIISADEVRRRDRPNLLINFGLVILFLGIGIIMVIRRKMKRAVQIEQPFDQSQDQ